MITIDEVAVYDLRRFKTAEEVKEIRRISNVGVLIYPEKADAELRMALNTLQTEDIGATVYLDENVEIITRNGIIDLNETDFKNSPMIVCNGVCIVRRGRISGSIMVNGILIMDKSHEVNSDIKIPFINGRRFYMEFDKVLTYENKVIVNSDFLDYVKPNTLMCAVNKIIVSRNVTEDMLVRSGVKFVAGNKVVCTPAVAPFMKANAVVGNKYEISDRPE